MSMMKGRNIVVLVGGPLFISLILKGGVYFAVSIVVISAFALGEFYSILERKGAKPIRWMGMASTVFIADYFYVQPELSSHMIIGTIFLIIILTLIWELFSLKKNPSLNVASTFAGILIIPLMLSTAIDIRQFDYLMGTNITLCLILSIWSCDSMGFFAGTLFGTKKIFPEISPGKSLVGCISGLFASILSFLIFYELKLLGNHFSTFDVIIFGFITGFFGQIGDFVESMFKRDAGIKDSGVILAGHGGFFDRFDSMIFAMPLAYLYIHFIKQF